MSFVDGGRAKCVVVVAFFTLSSFKAFYNFMSALFTILHRCYRVILSYAGLCLFGIYRKAPKWAPCLAINSIKLLKASAIVCCYLISANERAYTTEYSFQLKLADANNSTNGFLYLFLPSSFLPPENNAKEVATFVLPWSNDTKCDYQYTSNMFCSHYLIFAFKKKQRKNSQ